MVMVKIKTKIFLFFVIVNLNSFKKKLFATGSIYYNIQHQIIISCIYLFCSLDNCNNYTCQYIFRITIYLIRTIENQGLERKKYKTVTIIASWVWYYTQYFAKIVGMYTKATASTYFVALITIRELVLKYYNQIYNK